MGGDRAAGEELEEGPWGAGEQGEWPWNKSSSRSSSSTKANMGRKKNKGGSRWTRDSTSPPRSSSTDRPKGPSRRDAASVRSTANRAALLTTGIATTSDLPK